MAGIYIHIPFCKKACHYCNFHFSTSTTQKEEMVKAICKEAALRHGYINENICTIYFGGGTPSLLTKDEIQSMMDALHGLFKIDLDAEITLEANPDDITPEKLINWKANGINRLSIGVQSFFEDDLQWMNRAHTSSQALESILLAKQRGFENITIDLIYGTPTLSDEKWKKNIETAISLNITHLSCYALTVEPKTALEKMIAQHKIENVDAEKQSHHFELLMQWMGKAGYEHYEISNFAKPGFRSKHNSSYWKGLSYIGLGPSAHSFNGTSRQWNVANNALYIKNTKENVAAFEIETLTETQQLNEYIMTGLRLMEGISLEHISKKWGKKNGVEILEDAKKFISNEQLSYSNQHLVITAKGRLFADGIASELFRE